MAYVPKGAFDIAQSFVFGDAERFSLEVFAAVLQGISFRCEREGTLGGALTTLIQASIGGQFLYEDCSATLNFNKATL